MIRRVQLRRVAMSAAPLSDTPYRLPPEWAPQSGVMLTWPHAASDWGARLPEVEPVFVAIARAVCRYEKLVVACMDASHRAHVRDLLQDAGVPPGRYHLHLAPSNDTWARDHGPITVATSEGQPRLLDFQFNGWGGKYPSELDNDVTLRLHEDGAFDETPLETIDFVLEGGSIEVDGRGTLLTTARCLLAPTRNPTLTPAHIEARLRAALGVERILWLQHGYLAGDDTDSHIDTLARFCDEHTIAYVACPDAEDEHYADLQQMESELAQMCDRDGAPYRLVPLPWPQARYDETQRRLPATYANFLIVNGAVLLPVYDDPADPVAIERLAACFPGRDIVPIPCLPLIRQYGSLHCVTMQLPRGVLP